MNEKSHKTERPIVIGIVGNFLLAIIKFITGFFGNSYALIADAIESTTDVFSSFLTWLGVRYANKPADDNHPYGHGKAEALITFVVVVFLILAASTIAYQSILNIQTPHEIPEAYTLYVLLAIVVIKELLYRLLKKRSTETNSSALHAEAWHHRSDAITSFMALIGISIALIFGEGFEIADDIAALLASAFIIYNAYLIFRPALGEVMDEHQYPKLEEKIRQISTDVKGVENVEKCLIRKVGVNYFVDMHVRVNGNLTVRLGHDIAHNIKKAVKDKIKAVGDVLIHIEPD